MKDREPKPGVVALDTSTLYTTETIVYKEGVNSADVDEPISFGRDVNGVAYVNDGNHRAKNADQGGGVVLGKQISQGHFDVKTDPDFRLVGELKIK